VLIAVREVQIPLIAALLLGGCTTKVLRTLRTGSIDQGLGPVALFPVRMRQPLAMVMCGLECGLGIGLIVTVGFGHGTPANCIRLGAGLLFLVATSALIELRATRPDVGCGCFGDFSTAPVSGRTLARSALLAVASLSTLGLHIVRPGRHGAPSAGQLLVIMAAELVLLGALSPELGEGLIRLGYSEPCELRAVPAERTLAALRRGKLWRRHVGLIISEHPADIWRELCWRYVVFPALYQGRSTEVVFAVFLQQRRPAVHAALVDAATGEPLPWPSAPSRPGRLRWRPRRLPTWRPAEWNGTARPPAVHPDMPVSSKL
jgi:hypothetical protein